MDGSWALLPQADSARVPPVLIKVSVRKDSYSLHLTDLTYIWDEHLDRSQIIRRARDEDTSIDPSEDASQLKILLESIRSALLGHEGTCLELKRSDSDDTLDIRLTASLPRPLEPLEWRVHLTRASPNVLKSEFTLPMLLKLHLKGQQVKNTVSVLEDKDHVIDKLLDKLETAGLDLATVFPGAARIKVPKRGMQREKAAPYVKGLGKFDIAWWKEHDPVEKASKLSLEEILSEVVVPANGHSSNETTVHGFGTSLEGWWRQLDRHPSGSAPPGISGPSNLQAGRIRSAPRKADQDPAEVEAAVDDEFQRQITPPHRKGPPDGTYQKATAYTLSPAINSVAPSAPNEADETEEDEDLDNIPVQPNQMRKTPEEASKTPKYAAAEVPRPAKKLGLIGGTKASKLSVETAPKSTPIQSSREGTADHSETESTAPTPKNPSPSPRKPRLGTIGGRHANVADDSTPEQSQSLSPSKIPHRIGVIGGRRRPTPDIKEQLPNQPNDNNAPGVAGGDVKDKPAPEPAPPAPDSPRESSQERADRKRILLRHQLEVQSKAPAKKKRKF